METEEQVVSLQAGAAHWAGKRQATEFFRRPVAKDEKLKQDTILAKLSDVCDDMKMLRSLLHDAPIVLHLDDSGLQIHFLKLHVANKILRTEY